MEVGEKGGLPASLDAWKQLIETLIPPDQLAVKDVAGGTYVVIPKLPARIEMRLIQKLTEIASLPASAGLKAKFLAMGQTKGRGGQVGAMLDIAGQLVAHNDEILTILGEAFAIAYEDTVAEALANVREKRPKLLKGIEHPTAADIFEVAELLAAIVPFGVGIVKGAMDKLSILQSPQPRTT
jgi:hypothetical protein